MTIRNAHLKTAPLHTVHAGSRGGIPVVLLHGAGLDLTYWDAQIAALGAHHDVIAMDLPGHGRSPGTPEDWTLERAGRAITDTLDGLGLDQVDLVGFSVGGVLAQVATLRRPDLVRSLTLIDTAAGTGERGRSMMRAVAQAARTGGMDAVVEPMIGHWFTQETKDLRPDLVERATRSLLAGDPQVFAALWEMLPGVDLIDQLPRIQCPTLILVGEFDSTSTVADAVLLRDRIPRAQLAVIPGAAHMAPTERPDVVSHHLVSFLANLPYSG